MATDSTDKLPGKARILIASPDEALLGRLARAIAAGGADVERTTSVDAAVRLLGLSRCQAVLVDADGIGEDVGGYLSNIRQSHPDVVVLVTATDPSRQMLLDLIHGRVFDFFPKPVDTGKLRETVQSVCAASLAEGRIRDSTGSRASGADRATLPQEIFRTNQELRTLNGMLRRQVSQLTILYQMGRDISEKENWSDALDRFLMALVNYIGAEGAALLLFSEGETRLAARSNFQVDPAILSQSCQVLVQNWRENPRGSEIHAIESYREMVFSACLDRRRPWRFTIMPLTRRNRSLGFLFIDKRYGSGHSFRGDYQFLNSLQTILAEEVVNASYISELRQLSRFNHRVLDNIQSGVITTDLKGRVRFHNEQAASLCPQILGRQKVHFDDLFASEAFGDDFYKKVLRSAKDTHVLSVDCRRGRKSSFPARLSTTKMHDDNLNGTVLVAIFEDLTEQKRMEEEIRRNDRLRVLGQLSAGVAHEIRNPLTGIATTVQVLGSKMKEDAGAVKYIRVIMEEIDRLNTIVRNLLDFAHPTKPQIEELALVELSQRVTRLLADEARKKGIDLEVEDNLTHKVCSADASQLTQVLLNMVLNSIQACRRGDHVKIVLKNEDDSRTKNHRFARIDVMDDGVGVPPEVRGSLFEPFVTTKTNGTGLGLAISQQIVEEHRGKISCEFLDKGTCFTIRLPISRESRPDGGVQT
jgi:nitrogen-specific signal transduction histidine kinase/DNA-binding response OmpR family regulator